MVRHAQNLDAIGLKMFLKLNKFGAVLHLEGNVLDPFRRVLVAPHFGLCRQFEKGQHIALAGIEKHMHVGIGFVSGGHVVFGDGEDEIHSQHVAIPFHGFFRILAAIGDVVDLFDFHDVLRDALLRSYEDIIASATKMKGRGP